MSDSRPLRIGLDVGLLGTQSEGIRHWTLQTFRALIRDNPHHHFTLVWPLGDPNPEPADVLCGPNTEVFVVRPQSVLRKVGRRIGFLSDLRRVSTRLARLDVLHWGRHAEYCFPWLHRLPGVPTAVTAYDAIPLALPDAQTSQGIPNWERYIGRVRELGSWWLTISEHARDDLAKFGRLDPSKAYVVYPGHNFDGTDGPVPDGPLPPDLTGQIADRPYVLIVSTLEPRKNHIRLFRAFSELVSRPEFAHWKLVAVGGRGWLDDPILAEAKRTPGLVLAGRRSHEELAALYRHAAVFAFPSLYEGFGLPVAEAMSFGLPVLTSNTSSLPEVAGEAAVLVDPADQNAIRDGLGRLMESPDLRAKLAVLAKERAGRFRWDQSAREVMRFLERIAAAKRSADG